MRRRSFLGSLLAAAVAPAIVRPASLMPILVPKPEVELVLPPGFLANAGDTITIFEAGAVTTFVQLGRGGIVAFSGDSTKTAHKLDEPTKRRLAVIAAAGGQSNEFIWLLNDKPVFPTRLLT